MPSRVARHRNATKQQNASSKPVSEFFAEPKKVRPEPGFLGTEVLQVRFKVVCRCQEALKIQISFFHVVFFLLEDRPDLDAFTNHLWKVRYQDELCVTNRDSIVNDHGTSMI
jgi:hypothetical protein